MKKVYCDICGGLIHRDAAPHRLILPTWNMITHTVEVKEYPDVCDSCAEDISVYIAAIFNHASEQTVPEQDESTAVEWHPVSECPPAAGRYLVADTRLNVSGRPHVSIAMYDDDEWATNALIHPEDIICWTDIPETPDRFFKEKDLIEEDDEQ